MARLIKELNLKASVIRRYNLERFVSKRDNAYQEDKDVGKAEGRKHAGRPMGSRSHGKDGLDGFLYFLKDGNVPIDNSEAERTVKSFALSRRNFLFVRSGNGGDSSAVALTMIQNAYSFGLEPLSYMEWAIADAYKGNADHVPWSQDVPDHVRMR